MSEADAQRVYAETLSWAAGLRAGMAFSTSILCILVNRGIISSDDAAVAVLTARQQVEKQTSLTEPQRAVALASFDEAEAEVRR